MNRAPLFLALALLSTSLIASDLRTGLWSAQLDGDSLYVNLMRPSRDARFGQNNFGTSLALTSFSGLTKADINAPAANVQFALNAPAGMISFEGRFSNGNGAGSYRFTPSDAFMREMESLGYKAFGDEKMLLFAITGFRPQAIRDLRALGYTIDQQHVDDVAIFRIDANAVKEYAALGYPHLTLRELIDFRVGHIDAAFVRGMHDVGFDNLTAREMMNLGVLRVTPQYVRELKGAGLTSLTPRQATDLKIGRITAAKIAEYKRLGYNLTPRQLADFGIHGVTPQFIEEQRARGEKDLTPQHLIELKIFNRTAQR